MKCPYCEKEMPESLNFCISCGKPIPHCSICGNPILFRTDTCLKCGEAVSPILVMGLPNPNEEDEELLKAEQIRHKEERQKEEERKQLEQKKQEELRKKQREETHKINQSRKKNIALMFLIAVVLIVGVFSAVKIYNIKNSVNDNGVTVATTEHNPIENNISASENAKDDTSHTSDNENSQNGQNEQSIQETSAGNQDSSSEEAVTNVSPESDSEESVSDSSSEPAPLVYADNTSDYSDNLDAGEYLRYNTEEFSFSYPARLYSESNVYVDRTEDIDGMNKKTVELYGDDDISMAVFREAERTDSKSKAQMMSDLYDYYSAQLYSLEKITYSEEKERFIVTGYSDSNYTDAVYLLVRVTDSSVMTMQVDFPFYGDKSTDDYKQKCYVVECIYRSCSFSGSNNSPRSYQEYLEDN